MQNLPKLLLIAGTGRNTGKTTLACEIIKHFSLEHQIIGLKISPHFHGGTESLNPIVESENYNLYEETLNNTEAKDSSRMLASGASQVFYIEVLDDYILDAFNSFLKHIPPGSIVVCESPALRKVIDPGLFIIVDNISQQNKKTDVLERKEIADLFIETDKTEIADVVPKISHNSKGWTIF